ncbi:uncharacterized protein K02A2.6-like [Aedes albopictus]|uniref:RNA-directed DNA polymerase n=1 Tax=Aedes albopictus TaxID=7160 RepID=A0ABM1Z8M0_AEDAL
MADADLKQAILRLTDLITTQQQQIAALQQGNAYQTGSEKIIESLSTGIDEFQYDPNDGIFFDSWYARVLPNHPRDFGFEDTVKKPKKLFGRQKSLFNARYQCLQYVKNDADDFSSYAASVAKHCEAFQMENCPATNSRLSGSLIGKLEAEENAPPADGATLKLENLVEACNRIINLNRIHVRSASGRSTRKATAPHPKRSQPKPKDVVKSKGISVKRVDLSKKRKYVKIEINGSRATLQLDCASDITIISKRTWTSVGKPVINPSEVDAVSVSGDSIGILGEFNAEITVQDVTKSGRIFVTSNPDLNVLGIETIDQFDLWSVPFCSLVNNIQQNLNATMQKLQAKIPKVIQSTFGCCSKSKVTLYPKPDTRPVYCLKVPVAYATLPKFSDWAAPIVVIRKSNVSVRICGDNPTGLNDALESDRHPLPHSDDIFAELAGCRYFSCIDLSDAYPQVEVEESSRRLPTISTHKGLFQYNRLPSGVKSAPGAFQSIIDSMVPGVKPYLDDILIAGRTQEEHDLRLHAVLERIREYGFHLRIEKCRFSLPQIKFLGHIVDKNGLRPDPAKTRAISETAPPTNVSQLGRTSVRLTTTDGIDWMKSLASSFVYWPNFDEDVESFVRQCRSCAAAAKLPRKTTLSSWPIPTKPWKRIHIDYAGPIDGDFYLSMVDAHSKWPEIFRTRGTTTTATLELLQETFARYGNFSVTKMVSII